MNYNRYSAATRRAARTPAASADTRSSHRFDGPGARFAVVIEAGAQRIDQSGADHDAIGARPRWRAPARRSCTPKPTATGSLVWRLMRVTARADLAVIGRGRAGDAGDRDVIDEARRVGEHRRQALVVGGRRRQADEVEAGLQAPAGKARRLPRAADRPRSGRRRRPPSHRRGICRRRRCRSDCSSPSARSASRRRLAGMSRTSASVFFMVCPALSARTPAAWIAGPSAIGSVNGMPSSITSAPAFGNAFADSERGVVIGIARHGESDQRGAAFALERGEALLDARAHSLLAFKKRRPPNPDPCRRGRTD